MYFGEIYNFCPKHFSKFLQFIDRNVINHDFYGFLLVFTIKIKFAPIFTIISVMIALKYVKIPFFKKNIAKVPPA